MKLIAIFALMSFLNTSYASEKLTCKSDDFNPEKYDGQALTVTFNETGKLTEVKKVEGSWFGDTGVVKNPKILSSSSKRIVYEVNFNNDEYDGRVIVSSVRPVTKITYQFSYADDEQNRTSTSVLSCE